VELDAKWQAARYDLGVLYLKQEHYARAVEHFEAVLQSAPDDLDAAYFLAIAYKEIGRLEETVQLLERVTLGRPDHFMAHFHLGATLLRLGHSQRGLHHIREYERLKRAQPAPVV
jgi:tetratricopeptide (TPR) repeat protein